MLEWIARGLAKRRITTRYPTRPDRPPAGFAGQVELLDATDAPPALAAVCPTGAIRIEHGQATLDRGRCILCGECVRAAPARFTFSERYESAARARAALVLDGGGSVAEPEPSARRVLGEQARTLRRSIHVRHIDCGSDGAEEWEIQALWNPYYDIQRLGFFLTAAPRHADVLLVTGGVTAPLRAPLQRTWEVMPEPKALIAVGTDACSGGLAAAGGQVAGGVDQVLGVDVYVPGSPPAPIAILEGLLLAVGLLKPQEAVR
ncbi:MAG: NADH:ubiquinone oxidoreductase [Solirubrobacteraceae bacterium]